MSKSKYNFWFFLLVYFNYNVFLICSLKSSQMINANNFLFVGPAVPFGGGSPLYSLFICISSFCTSWVSLLRLPQNSWNLMLNLHLPLSANASCHTSLFSRPKTALRPLDRTANNCLIPKRFHFRNQLVIPKVKKLLLQIRKQHWI